MRKLTLVMLAALLTLLALGMTACDTGSQGNVSGEKQRSQAVHQRLNTFARAEAQVPAPSVNAFPRRQTLADAVKRQSEPNHPWYVYVLGQNGNVVNYFVAKSVPVNDCDYLSSTEQLVDSHDATWQISAPSLEGIYQSGSGCNTLTFFDLSTNAEIQITSLQSFVTDRPLKVDAAPIKVRGSK